MKNEIFETTNYDMFSFLEYNRNVKEIQRLVKAFNQINLFHFRPVICNEDLQIIDGQNRFEAAKILKIPVFYGIIPNEDTDIALVVLNNNQKQWKGEDFIKMYSFKENPHYRGLWDFADEYNCKGSALSYAIVAYCEPQQNYSQLKSGKSVFEKSKYADETIRLWQKAYKEMYPRPQRPLIVAIRKYLENGFSYKKLENKIDRITPRVSSVEYYKQLLQVTRQKETI